MTKRCPCGKFVKKGNTYCSRSHSGRYNGQKSAKTVKV